MIVGGEGGSLRLGVSLPPLRGKTGALCGGSAWGKLYTLPRLNYPYLCVPVSHIEKCRNLWYATLKVPPDVQEKLGKTKFKQSLGTSDKRRAQELAAPLVALWKAQIRKARGQGDAVYEEAIRWREAYEAARREGDEDLLEVIPSLITDKAEQIEEQRGEHMALQFAAIAQGLKTPSKLHFDAWRASIINLAQKTQDQAEKDVQRLVDEFVTLEAITPVAARDWVQRLQAGGASESSLKRMISFWRSYWRYLGSIAVVEPKSFPFSVEMIQRRPGGRGRRGDSWLPFPPDKVPDLWAAAEARGDAVLAHLIKLGAYTGARIEELCSLKVEHVDGSALHIADAKTPAGIRDEPVHPSVTDLVAALRKASTDGYLLSGLTLNKYGDRSNAIGKRFGRLKTDLGFGEQHVFHSLRKTVVTLLEDAGVSENLAADIVGHEKPRITYGLYSGGASLGTKAQALSKVHYPSVQKLGNVHPKDLSGHETSQAVGFPPPGGKRA